MTTEKKYQFIIIDDHPFIRDGIINFISADSRFEAIGEFADTRSVLNSTFNGRPDVIILDLNLPGIDGERSYPLLKNKFPDCKIVAFTQYEGRDKELSRLGFDGYIVKSEKDSLLDALISVLNGFKYFNSNDKINSGIPVLSDKMDNFLKVKLLTKREIEIAKYIIQDFSNKEIGEKIFISESTVETHRKHIKEKLKAKNKRELTAILKGYDFNE